MTYVCWAAVFEGNTDKSYFVNLIPRVMEDITLNFGTRNSTIPPQPAVNLRRTTNDDIAAAICAASEAFHIVFVHADRGGRNLANTLDARGCAICEAAHQRCDFPLARCIVIGPNHETEAWVLADAAAITEALGYSGNPDTIGLPRDALAAERLPDPKRTLEAAVQQVRGNRRTFNVSQLFPAIAQKQSLTQLRRSESFAEFESALRMALVDLGCVRAE